MHGFATQDEEQHPEFPWFLIISLLLRTGHGAVRAPERITRLRLAPAEALRPEPALMIANHLPAVGAVLQVGRHRGPGHLTAARPVRTIREHRNVAPRVAFRRRFARSPVASPERAFVCLWVEGIMGDKEVYSDPSEVSAEDGVVNVDGPDSVDVALTPEAARETSDRLLEGAMVAQGQKHFEEQQKR